MERLSNLSDAVLLGELHALAGSHRRVTTELIVHLGEVDARRLHVEKGFSSLFAYCVEELSFSEDEACRRIDAARLPSGAEPASRIQSATTMVSGLAAVLGARQTPRARVEPLSSDRFLVKFTASRTLRDKLEHARDLMGHANPDGDLSVILERAVDLLIAELERKRKGSTTRPLQTPRPAGDSHVTRSARREVVARDGWRCSFVADGGRRCNAQAFLEFDHETPKGQGGVSQSDNLRLLCRAHNRLAAERVYGKEHIANAISIASRARKGDQHCPGRDPTPTCTPSRATTDKQPHPPARR